MKTTDTKAVRGARDFQSRVKKLALIGCGKMGEGLLSGMLGSQLIPVERRGSDRGGARSAPIFLPKNTG